MVRVRSEVFGFSYFYGFWRWGVEGRGIFLEVRKGGMRVGYIFF